jgi:hypothetical protein
VSLDDAPRPHPADRSRQLGDARRPFVRAVARDARGLLVRAGLRHTFGPLVSASWLVGMPSLGTIRHRITHP